MAEETDRESTRARLLAMAADYEKRSMAAGVPIEPAPDTVADTTAAAPEPEAAGTVEPAGEAGEADKPARPKSTRLKLDRQAPRDTKETIVMARRPTTRRA